MLEFGQDISFVALVIIEMILELDLRGKPRLRHVHRPSPKHWERPFSSVTKSNIEMQCWNLARTLVLWHL